MAFVEPDGQGRYPERLENTPRDWLEDIWRRLGECERAHDPVALERARRQAAAARDQAIAHALDRVGMTIVGELIQDVDFRGW